MPTTGIGAESQRGAADVEPQAELGLDQPFTRLETAAEDCLAQVPGRNVNNGLR